VKEKPMNRLGRIPWASEAVGALVLAAIGLFFIAALQGGVLRQWFSPTEKLRIVLPEQGLFGLAAGAPVEVLGTKAGEVKRIVIDPGQSFYAEADIDDAMRTFIRRDSRAFIRKQFGIAGAAYLEISRGQGEPLDWDFAVITAEVDRAPTENVGQLVEDLRAKVLPIIDQTNRAVTALADLAEQLRAPDGKLNQLLASTDQIVGNIARGDGVVGRLLTDDRLVGELQSTVATARQGVEGLRPVVENLQRAAGNLAQLTSSVARDSQAVPRLVADANATVASLRQITADVSQTSPGLPALLAQTQQTTLELERLLTQVRSLWLLGGSGQPPASDERLSPLEVRP